MHDEESARAELSRARDGLAAGRDERERLMSAMAESVRPIAEHGETVRRLFDDPGAQPPTALTPLLQIVEPLLRERLVTVATVLETMPKFLRSLVRSDELGESAAANAATEALVLRELATVLEGVAEAARIRDIARARGWID